MNTVWLWLIATMMILAGLIGTPYNQQKVERWVFGILGFLGALLLLLLTLGLTS